MIKQIRIPKRIAIITREELNEDYALVRIVYDGKVLFESLVNTRMALALPSWRELGVRTPDTIVTWNC